MVNSFAGVPGGVTAGTSSSWLSPVILANARIQGRRTRAGQGHRPGRHAAALDAGASPA
ncbi:MAG: hypothetical protein U5S82_16095 [Gammaproteobacteria bacterium]|nr:hypothetical protein [Gammaproteobacteria bacterium]